MPDKQLASHIAKNPFTPEFGRVPAYMAGRQDVISEMARAFDEGSGNPNLCTIFVGARGTGKTAMLSYLSDEATRLGWVAANVTATPGMLEDIVQRSKEAAAHLLLPEGKRKLTGVEVAGIGAVSWENESGEAPNWRSRMNAILNELGEEGTGLLITIDEVDPGLDEMIQVVTTYQHFIREDRKVALLMAGLPHNVSALLSGKVTSFLRRASQYDLGGLFDDEVEEAFRLTVEEGGRVVEQDALDIAVHEIGGFPFMFQLVGYRAWNTARGGVITKGDVTTGARLAREELSRRIFDSTYAELSKGDRAFLAAMLDDDGYTTRDSLMQRLGKTTSYISTYKKRLLEAGVIEEQEPGVFTFALPGFRDYLLGKKSH